MMTPERTIVQVRLTARDKRRVEAAAACEGITVSDFLRRVMRAAVDRKTERAGQSRQIRDGAPLQDDQE